MHTTVFVVRQQAQCPGRPGWSPTRAPHRPARADFPHAVPQVVVSLSLRDLRSVPTLTRMFAIRQYFVYTALGSIAPFVFPADGSTIRRPSSLPRVPSGQVPLLPRYYKSAKTSRCPSCRASFPSLGNTIYSRRPYLFAPLGFRDASALGPGVSYFGDPCPVSYGMETTRSPKFLGSPYSHLPCSPTPAGPSHQAI
jgi:hypothetical protein